MPRQDYKDAGILLRKKKPRILVADKGYDANELHVYCCKNNIQVHIPMRDHGKPRNKRMSKRRMAAKYFDEAIYGRRELIESGFGGVKRKFGSNVSSKKSSTIKSEIYSRLVCYNIFLGFVKS